MKKNKNAREKRRYNWLPDFVYGGMDGAVTTFAVVAGVEGASLSPAIVLILGFANLFADGFSMAVGKYSSDHAEKQRIQGVRRMLFDAVKQRPEAERIKLKKILRGRGFKGKDLDRAVEVIERDKSVWVETLMLHEHGLIEENIEPVKGALSTFLAFNLIGFIPLAAYVFNGFLKLDTWAVFELTVLFTLGALFVVGGVKGRIVERNWILSGLETAFIGGTAATIAYLVGFLLKNIG